jgi:hypothetical protein
VKHLSEAPNQEMKGMGYITRMLAPSRQPTDAREDSGLTNDQERAIIALMMIEAGLILFILTEFFCLVGCA